MGGGRGNEQTKYIYVEWSRDHYRIHSNNLKLVMILECVDAAGAKMPPWFVLKTGSVPEIRDLVRKVGGLVI